MGEPEVVSLVITLFFMLLAVGASFIGSRR